VTLDPDIHPQAPERYSYMICSITFWSFHRGLRVVLISILKETHLVPEWLSELAGFLRSRGNSFGPALSVVDWQSYLETTVAEDSGSSSGALPGAVHGGSAVSPRAEDHLTFARQSSTSKAAHSVERRCQVGIPIPHDFLLKVVQRISDLKPNRFVLSAPCFYL